MSVSFENAMDILWVIIFNPVPWLFAVALCVFKYQYWQVIFAATIGNFLSLIGISFYHSHANSIGEVVNIDWLIFAVPESIFSGVVVGTLVFCIFKLRRKSDKSSA